jgi:hypothetical protein
MAGILILVLVVLAVVFGPLLLIWALNTLFGLGIAYTFLTWLAALILGATVGGSRGSRS